jgi:acyl-CoA thioester hydrolase
MPHAFRRGHGAVLLPAHQHVRFLKEVRPGQPIVLRGAVIGVGETTADVYQELVHVETGEIAAAIRTRLVHLDRWEASVFPWSRRVRTQLDRLVTQVPEAVPARSIDPDGPMGDETAISLQIAQAAGVREIGLGRFGTVEGDINGRVRPEAFMGKVSDSVPNLMGGWRQAVGAATGVARTGAAVLELRLNYRNWPVPGERWVLCSDIVKVEPRAHTLVHWILDPVSGRPWVTAQAVAVTFDLDQRKAIAAPAEALDQLRGLTPGVLRP